MATIGLSNGLATGSRFLTLRTDEDLTMAELSLEKFALLMANLYRHEPDSCVITLGDWQPSPVPGDREPLFHGTVRVTVGDFRRWAPEALRDNQP